ncbi:MAG: thioesterase [Hymenobacter sp.]
MTVRYKYLTQNPFRSIYFACLAMAAELASGIQAMMQVQGVGRCRMLVVGLHGRVQQESRLAPLPSPAPMGRAIVQAVAESRATGEGRTVVCTSTGLDEAGDVVAVFRVTWSFRAKK